MVPYENWIAVFLPKPSHWPILCHHENNTSRAIAAYKNDAKQPEVDPLPRLVRFAQDCQYQRRNGNLSRSNSSCTKGLCSPTEFGHLKDGWVIHESNGD